MPEPPDNDEPDTPERAAEIARLDAAILADAALLKELDGRISRDQLQRVEVIVRLGRNWKRRTERLNHGEKLDYLLAQIRALGYGQTTSYDWQYYAEVHDSDPQRFNFTTLVNLRVDGVRAAYRRLRGREHRAGRTTEQREAQDVANAAEAAALIVARLDRTDLKRLLLLQQEGIKFEDLRDWIAGWIMWRGEPMTEEEQSRGLSDLFVDSGAYVAFSQGQRIDLDQYCDRLLENPWMTTYANLDVINPNEPEEAAEASYRNFKYMQNRGLDPIPTYHAGENFSWLQKYIDEGCNYIAFGGVANNSPERNAVVFDECFEILARAGRPIKTHAFGIAHEWTLVNYNFASSDASTWIQQALVARDTALSRLGNVEWRLSLFERDNNETKYAAQLYLEAWDAQRLERQIRGREGREAFNFYLVVAQPSDPWLLSALWAVHHRSALVSNGQNWNPALVKRFIDDPQSVLTEQRFADKLRLLKRMNVKHYKNLSKQSRRQDELDERARNPPLTGAPSAAPSSEDE